MTTSDAPGYLSGMQAEDPSLDAAGLVAAYRAGVEELHAAVAGLSAAEAVARPIPGKWSTLEVVAHLADCDLMFAERVFRTLGMTNPLHLGMDEAGYAAGLNYQALDLGDELALFAAVRRRMARVLAGLPADAWGRTSVHAAAGTLTVRQLVLQPVRHLRHHLPFVAEKRAALRGAA